MRVGHGAVTSAAARLAGVALDTRACRWPRLRVADPRRRIRRCLRGCQPAPVSRARSQPRNSHVDSDPPNTAVGMTDAPSAMNHAASTTDADSYTATATASRTSWRKRFPACGKARRSASGRAALAPDVCPAGAACQQPPERRRRGGLAAGGERSQARNRAAVSACLAAKIEAVRQVPKSRARLPSLRRRRGPNGGSTGCRAVTKAHRRQPPVEEEA